MTQKKYMLLYLPSGKHIEVLAPEKIDPGYSPLSFKWHILVKNRTDLKKVLVRILEGKFPAAFYSHNEIINSGAGTGSGLLSCHFTFERVKE